MRQLQDTFSINFNWINCPKKRSKTEKLEITKANKETVVSFVVQCDTVGHFSQFLISFGGFLFTTNLFTIMMKNDEF